MKTSLPPLLVVPALAALLGSACRDVGVPSGAGNGSASAEGHSTLAIPWERPHVLALDPQRPRTAGLDSALMSRALERARSLPRLRCLLVSRHGTLETEWCAPGHGADGYANVKSVSKSVISALVGAAIEAGHLEGTDQRVLPFFADAFDTLPGPPKSEITVGDLLSMQSGLERTSGRNYGAWVSSRNWVRDAIRRPMVDEPGGRMLYSSGNSHLLSAILTEATGRSTLDWAREVLAEPLDIRIPPWLADPQGIYMGGNEMRLTPRGMIRFGELYRNHGRWDGRQILPRRWVFTSLEPRTRSRWSGEPYGYGWFLADAGARPMFFAWGYGGQFIFVVPDLALTVVTTSDPVVPRGGSHNEELHRLLDRWIVPAAERGAGADLPDAPVSGVRDGGEPGG